MKNNDLKSVLTDIAEEAVPGSDIDLLPTLTRKLAVQKPKNKISLGLFAQGSLLRRSIVTVLALALVFSILLVTPQGRAFAQSILQFFVRTESDILPVPTEPVTWVEMTPGVVHPTKTPLPPMAIFADDCGDFPTPTCSVEQIREKVDFTVKELSNIPDAMYFIGATGGQDTVFLKYEFENHSGGLTIFEERWLGKPAEGTSEVGASAIVEQVQIGDLVGEYFRGSFVMQAGETETTWDPNFGAETLRWVDGDISYTLQYDFTTQEPLGKEAFVALAESMTTEPVAKPPIPATATPEPIEWNPRDTFNLSIPQVEELAGFKLLLPPVLPEFLSLVGAMYEPETKVVRIFYILEEPYMNGLYLSQQIISNPDDCAICDIVVGDSTVMRQDHGPMVVGTNANFDIVQIGDITGKYAEGVLLGSGIWEPDPFIKNLRWQANGRAFELQDLGSELNKADLIAIAENLK